MTGEPLINRFLNQQRRDGKSALTVSAYATDLKQFSSFLSVSSVLSVSPSQLNEICRKWTAGFSPNAAARKLTTLRSFLNWGYKKGYLKKDLSISVFRPKRQTSSPAKPLTASQIARLRRVATMRERLLLELLLSTGMRLGEVLSLKMKHMNLRKFSIRYSVFGIIPINEYLRQALDYYLAAVTRGPRSYLLVSPKTGRPPGVRAAGMILSKLGKRAGVRGVTPRNLRAAFRSVVK